MNIHSLSLVVIMSLNYSILFLSPFLNSRNVDRVFSKFRTVYPALHWLPINRLPIDSRLKTLCLTLSEIIITLNKLIMGLIPQ